MANNNRSTHSHPSFISSTSDLKSDHNLSFRTSLHQKNPECAVKIVDRLIRTPYQSIDAFDFECQLSFPPTRVQTAPASITLKVDHDPYTCKHLKYLIVRKMAREYVRRSHKVRQETVEAALSNYLYWRRRISKMPKNCSLPVH